MHDKSQTETSSSGNVPSQQSFPQTFDENEQLRTDTSSQRIEACEFIDSEELARRWHVPVSWMLWNWEYSNFAILSFAASSMNFGWMVLNH